MTIFLTDEEQSIGGGQREMEALFCLKKLGLLADNRKWLNHAASVV
jgi:hypothetical protein